MKTALAPYTLALTPQERHAMLKMGDKSLAFVEKTHDYAQDNPTLVPSYLDMDDFDKDFSDAHGLWRLHTAIHQLDELVEDTIMAAGERSLPRGPCGLPQRTGCGKTRHPRRKSHLRRPEIPLPRRQKAERRDRCRNRNRLNPSRRRLFFSVYRGFFNLPTFKKRLR